jgi:hypothetical protein
LRPGEHAGTSSATATWLPLDLGPGAEHVECLESGPREGLSGTIEWVGGRLRFAVKAGQPAGRLDADPG